jgi:hypothetical protein
MKNIRLAAVLLSGACAIGVAGCDKGETKDAQWYLRHGAELQKKLETCKLKPQAAKGDEECAAATQAFLKWYAASGQAAAATDERLMETAPADASTDPQPVAPDTSTQSQTPPPPDSPAVPQDADSGPAEPAQADQQN